MREALAGRYHGRVDVGPGDFRVLMTFHGEHDGLTDAAVSCAALADEVIASLGVAFTSKLVIDSEPLSLTPAERGRLGSDVAPHIWRLDLPLTGSAPAERVEAALVAACDRARFARTADGGLRVAAIVHGYSHDGAWAAADAHSLGVRRGTGRARVAHAGRWNSRKPAQPCTTSHSPGCDWRSHT